MDLPEVLTMTSNARSVSWGVGAGGGGHIHTLSQCALKLCQGAPIDFEHILFFILAESSII